LLLKLGEIEFNILAESNEVEELAYKGYKEIAIVSPSMLLM